MSGNRLEADMRTLLRVSLGALRRDVEDAVVRVALEHGLDLLALAPALDRDTWPPRPSLRVRPDTIARCGALTRTDSP